jgi:hypothetical protein
MFAIAGLNCSHDSQPVIGVGRDRGSYGGIFRHRSGTERPVDTLWLVLPDGDRLRTRL